MPLKRSLIWTPALNNHEKAWFQSSNLQTHYSNRFTSCLGLLCWYRLTICDMWSHPQCLPDCLLCLFKFRPTQLQSRGAHARVTHPHFHLDQFDELNELGHGIHSQQRQEPTVEIEGLFALAIHCIIEQF